MATLEKGKDERRRIEFMWNNTCQANSPQLTIVGYKEYSEHCSICEDILGYDTNCTGYLGEVLFVIFDSCIAEALVWLVKH